MSPEEFATDVDPAFVKQKPKKRGLTNSQKWQIAIGCVLTVVCAVGAGVFTTLYNLVIANNVEIGINSEGEFNWAGENWVAPSYDEAMKFYMYDVDNVHEVIYDKKKPYVIERGPYTFRQTDFKHNVSFSMDKYYATYHNYRTWLVNAQYRVDKKYWDQSQSCDTCLYDDQVTVQNLVYFGLQYQMKDVGVGDMLFSGYHDTLLSVFTFLGYFVQMPIEVPPGNGLLLGRWFSSYNHSHDGEYMIKTGVEDYHEIGQVVMWEKNDKLPDGWWSDKAAEQIRGSDGGQVQPPFMDENRVPSVFLTYWCRSFDLEFAKWDDVRGVRSIRYNIPANVFNVSAYPDYVDPKMPDLPDGLMSIPCQPGKRINISLPVIYSSPHFYNCDPSVAAAVNNLAPPDPELHQNGFWTYQDIIGYPVEIVFNQQINVPLNNDPDFMMLTRLSPLTMPMLWLGEYVMVDDDTRHTMRLFIMWLPDAFRYLLYFLIGLGVLLVLGPLIWPAIKGHQEEINKDSPDRKKKAARNGHMTTMPIKAQPHNGNNDSGVSEAGTSSDPSANAPPISQASTSSSSTSHPQQQTIYPVAIPVVPPVVPVEVLHVVEEPIEAAPEPVSEHGTQTDVSQFHVVQPNVVYTTAVVNPAYEKELEEEASPAKDGIQIRDKMMVPSYWT